LDACHFLDVVSRYVPDKQVITGNIKEIITTERRQIAKNAKKEEKAKYKKP
jgi:hypothetical protein